MSKDDMYTFHEIAGNEILKKSLQNAIVKGKTSHAYIFNGGEGMGKTLFAKTVAKTMQCEVVGANPCCTCVSCRTFDSMNNPDVFYVEPSTRKSIGVDDIREQVSRNIEIKPYKHKYKIFIIKNAHLMTPAAQNALLKTIEEPVGYGVFLLTSESIMNFLPTIISRSVVLKLRPLPDKSVKEKLIEAGVMPESADIFSAYARGSIGKAMRLKDDTQFSEIRELVFKTVSEKSRNITYEAFNAAKEYEPYKENIHDVLDIMFVWLRDVLVYKTTLDMHLIIEKSRTPHIKKEAGLLDEKSLFKKLDAVLNTGKILKHNANFGMAMDMLMIELKDGRAH